MGLIVTWFAFSFHNKIGGRCCSILMRSFEFSYLVRIHLHSFEAFFAKVTAPNFQPPAGHLVKNIMEF